MFTCDKCHQRIYKDARWSFSQSYGPCEWCEETSSTTDCHCQTPPAKKKAKQETTQ